ncbi:MAG: fibronectin type III domain-containing protein, partial [Bacteroidales bacterium]|nr:fibronectin type III domain-containing protein [Bacteroidales bacterium]
MKIHLYNLLLLFLILLNNNIFSQPVEIPVIDYVTINQATSLPVIHWSVPIPSAVNGYAIKRFIRSYPTVPDNTWHTIQRIDNPNVFNFEDNSITYGAAKPNLYSEIYEVTAFKINGSDTTYSLPSEKHKTIFLNGSYDYCPNSISLIWNNYIGWDSNFKQYEIYCKENNGSFTKIAQTNYNDTSFIHSNLNYHSNYTYYIKAVRNDGVESVSNLKKITVSTINFPAFLRIDSVTADNSELHISF